PRFTWNLTTPAAERAGPPGAAHPHRWAPPAGAGAGARRAPVRPARRRANQSAGARTPATGRARTLAARSPAATRRVAGIPPRTRRRPPLARRTGPPPGRRRGASAGHERHVRPAL